jgi:Raf kinase inhibitor-like YbhB/YbcL family protein
MTAPTSPHLTARAMLAALLILSAIVRTGLVEGAPPMAFTLGFPAFSAGGGIPARYTCDGEDISPPLVWSAPPPATKSLALIVDDPDAPDSGHPKMTWVHWVLYNLPPTASSLPEAVTDSALPAGVRQGVNDWKRPGYGGPCPPIGRHRYFFKLYALDVVLPDSPRLGKAQFEAASARHVLARSELIGTYEKNRS